MKQNKVTIEVQKKEYIFLINFPNLVIFNTSDIYS